MMNVAISNIARNMKNDFDMFSSTIKHNLSKGSKREDIVIGYLQKYLPFKYAITSGTIINAEGEQSRQQDIIIYDKFNCIRLFGNDPKDDEQVCIPIESVICVIEVKSTLTKNEITKVLTNYESVSTLSQKPLPINPVFRLSSDHFRPAGFCFAFSSQLTLDSAASEFKNQRMKREMQKHLSGIIILDKGVIQYNRINDVHYIDTNPTSNATETCHVCSSVDQALLYFTLMLTHTLNLIVTEQPDYLYYMESSKEFPIDKSFEISPELITADMKVIVEGEEVNIKKASEAARLFGMLHKRKKEIRLQDILFDDHVATLYFCSLYAMDKATLGNLKNLEYIITNQGIYPRSIFDESVAPVFEACLAGEDVTIDSDSLNILEYYFFYNHEYSAISTANNSQNKNSTLFDHETLEKAEKDPSLQKQFINNIKAIIANQRDLSQIEKTKPSQTK